MSPYTRHTNGENNMREIEKKALSAWQSGENFSSGNTLVRLYNNEKHLYLHGNLIAKVDTSGLLWVTLAGWNTPTTKSRLNNIALQGTLVRVSTIQYQPYWRLYSKHFDTVVKEKLWSDDWLDIPASALV